MVVPNISTLLPLIAMLTIATITHTCYGQDSAQDFLNAHNRARSNVGVGALKWDGNLANYAQNYLSQFRGSCNMVHSGGPYGENLAWGKPDLSGTAAVNMWVDEKRYYDYNSNSCAAGQVCGHYTQVVWRNSVRVGCAKVICNSGGGTLISCNYDPPGNYNGQWPYDISPFQVPLSFNHVVEEVVVVN